MLYANYSMGNTAVEGFVRSLIGGAVGDEVIKRLLGLVMPWFPWLSTALHQ